MVIPRIFHRHICSLTFPSKIKLENARSKRFLLRKIENISAAENARNSSYEAEGKTVGHVINKKGSRSLQISTYMTEGFSLVNGSQIVGPIILFPNTILCWHVNSAKDVTKESLVLFKLLVPKIDILVFGYGSKNAYTPEVRENFTKCCRELGIRFEALPTENAVGTYNFLADENRLVAGALIPPTSVDVLKFDRSNTLYLDDGFDDEGEFEVISDGIPEKKLLK